MFYYMVDILDGFCFSRHLLKSKISLRYNE
jgi:hypothetical protein